MIIADDDEFEIANRAFALFTLAERKRALERFANLRYASIVDRFTDAVHFVIMTQTSQPSRNEQP